MLPMTFILPLSAPAEESGFAITIVLDTLALSIGATTAMFSIVNGVLLAPLPFANADRLVWTVNHGTRPYDAMSPPDAADWGLLNNASRRRRRVDGSAKLALQLAATSQSDLTAAEVTGNWFTMLGGCGQRLGRGLVRDDQGPGKPKVVVLSDALWRRQFGAERDIVGHTVLIDGTRHTIVGVAAPSFTFPAGVDVWRRWWF